MINGLLANYQKNNTSFEKKLKKKYHLAQR